MKHVNRKPREFDEIVCGNVRRIRSLSGVSQSFLGDRLGVTAQQVQKYESGANRLTAGALVEIAVVLGVEIADLFRGCPKAGMVQDQPLNDNQKALIIEFNKISEARNRRLVSALVRALARDCIRTGTTGGQPMKQLVP